MNIWHFNTLIWHLEGSYKFHDRTLLYQKKYCGYEYFLLCGTKSLFNISYKKFQIIDCGKDFGKVGALLKEFKSTNSL